MTGPTKVALSSIEHFCLLNILFILSFMLLALLYVGAVVKECNINNQPENILSVVEFI
jgi:hypothetical protein